MPDNDHDLLIKLSANVTHLVGEIADLKSGVAEIQRSLPLTVEQTFRKLEKKVDWGKFWGILILLVGLAVGTIGYNFQLDADAHAKAMRNEAKIEMLQDKGIDDNVDSNIGVN